MAISYVTAIKNTRMTAVLNAIDAGSAAGKLNIYTSGYAALLVSITLADPCGTVSSGALTFSDMPKTGTAAGAGNAAIARLLDSDSTVVAEGLTLGVAHGRHRGVGEDAVRQPVHAGTTEPAVGLC